MTLPKRITENSDLSFVEEGIQDFCMQEGITPEQLGIDLKRVHTPYEKIGVPKFQNETATRFQFETEIKCPECNRIVRGLVALDKKSLRVVHSEGFTIIDKPICNQCIKW